MVVDAIGSISAWFPSISHSYDSLYQSLWHSPPSWMVIAQTIKDPNLIGNWQKSFEHFIQSGQVWALLIGLVLGYLIRSMTSYG